MTWTQFVFWALIVTNLVLNAVGVIAALMIAASQRRTRIASEATPKLLAEHLELTRHYTGQTARLAEKTERTAEAAAKVVTEAARTIATVTEHANGGKP